MKSTCLICDRKRADHLSPFFPDRPANFGGRRVIPFLMCGKCWRRGKSWWQKRAEKALAQRDTERN